MRQRSDAGSSRLAGELGRGGVVALTGAGVSTASGIPAFRGPGGLWEVFDPDRFGTWWGILESAMTHPDALADFLSRARKVFGEARPNRAHRALAVMERRGLVDAVITQNIDGLHQDAGSESVIEVHGSFRQRRCLSCGSVRTIERGEFARGMERLIAGLRSAFIPSLLSLLPRCAACGGPERPGFVAFGESVQDYAEARERARRCRVMLVVGTSGMVAPASELPAIARAAGARILQIDPEETEIEADIDVRGDAGRVLKGLVGELERKGLGAGQHVT